MATSGDAVGDSEELDPPTNNVIPSFSFSGCGFLGVYHVGVAACLRDHTDIVNRREIRFAGASAGALVATSLLCDLSFGEVTRILLSLAKAIRNRENVDLNVILRDLMHKCLPENAHIMLRNRLFISVTVLAGMRKALITDFHSKEHLIECLIASCFVPGFVGFIPPMLDMDDFIEMPSQVPIVVDHAVYEREAQEYRDRMNNAANEESTVDEGYLGFLVRMCFKSLRTTNKVVRRIPLCSTLLDTFTPEVFSQMDDFAEALILEMLTSEKYAAFDGGFSDNIPVFDKNTVTVCPFSGESDICPRDITGIDFSFDLANTSMHASEDNIFRLNHALNPLEPDTLHKLAEEGYNECLKFLSRKDMLSCRKHLMTRALLAPSPCNIGHPFCSCAICKNADQKIRQSLSCQDCQRTRRKALVSSLPQDVRHEFLRSAAEERNSHLRAMSRSYWNRLVRVLWWCAETMYASTLKATDLAMGFSLWLFRFWDSLSSIAHFPILSVKKKRKVVRFILSSLRLSISNTFRALVPMRAPARRAMRR